MNLENYKKFISLLDESIEFEDSLVESFTNFLKETVDKKLTSINEQSKKEIKEIIQELNNDSSWHKKTLVRLKINLEKKYDKKNFN
jgi:hypothetical protein